MNNVLKKNIEYFWENKENENFSDKSIKKKLCKLLISWTMEVKE